MNPEEISLAELTTDRELRQKIWKRVQAAAYRWESELKHGIQTGAIPPGFRGSVEG